MSELISVVIPAYNHVQELKQALASIQAQTYQNIEIIVVDDGSTVPIDYPQSDYGSYKLIRQENKGAPAARNRGMVEANGKFIIFWDADVIGVSRMLEKMHNVLTIHPESSYAYCGFYFGKNKMARRKFSEEELRQSSFIHSASLIRREDCPLWDESLKRFQDWDLWLTMLEKNKTGIYIPEYLFKVKPRSTGMSTWLPGFAYKVPFKWLPGFSKKVMAFEKAKQIVLDKHSLD